VLVYILSLNVVKRVYIQHLSMSNFKSNLMDNFFKRPVGAAVLYLNDFHFGKNLAVLNRAARLVPKDVKGFASLLSDTPNADPDHVQDIINLLDDYANDVDNDLIFNLNKS
tara:strand:+ start:50440 stop:50772 length:333 start_codon:yes stop_codon:yes gene_type:complete